MKQTWKPVTLLVLALATAGCAGSSNPLTHDEFWAATTIEGLEADSPENLEELVDDSKVIVVGRIEEVLRGPVEEAGYDEYAPIAQLNIRVDEALTGDVVQGDILKVLVARLGEVTVEEMADSIPTESLTFFLDEAGYLDYYSPTYRVGIIEEKKDGSLETVRDSDQTDVITGGAKTQVELVEEIEEATK